MKVSVQKKKIKDYIVYLNQPLGKGTFATVYLGKNTRKNQDVAIKVIDKVKIQKDQYYLRALTSEILIFRHLTSRNIVKFIDVKQTDNNFYIVQQLAHGTLEQLMKTTKFQEQEVLYYIKQILNGFGCLIKNGIIHRDIKPANILIKRQITIENQKQIEEIILKISDFGFAKQSDNISIVMKSMVGTPAYMAPQILGQKAYSYKCDIWSLGVIFFQLITGRFPFPLHHKNMLDNINEVKNSVRFPYNCKVSDKLKQLILGCLEYDEEKRYNWQDIYLHPIFEGIFNVNFTADKTSIKDAFMISQFRKTFHQKNLSVKKLIKNLPKIFNFDDFRVIIKLIDPVMKEKQIVNLLKIFVNKFSLSQQIPKQLFEKFLYSLGIQKIQLNSPQNQIHCVQEQDINDEKGQLYLLINRINQKIDLNDITQLYKLYRSEDKNDNKVLNFDAFTKLINKILPGLQNQKVKILYKFMDQNKDEKISFDEIISALSKIGGVLVIKNQNEQLLFSGKKK